MGGEGPDAAESARVAEEQGAGGLVVAREGPAKVDVVGLVVLLAFSEGDEHAGHAQVDVHDAIVVADDGHLLADAVDAGDGGGEEEIARGSFVE